MKTKTLGILATMAVVLTALAWLTTGRKAEAEASGDGELLLPALAANVNTVARIEARRRGSDLVLEKRGDDWVVPEMDGYPAKFDKIREMILQVSGLEKVQALTSKPERHASLDLGDPSPDDAASSRVALFGANGEPLCDLVIGRQSFGGTPTVYVRHSDGDQTWSCSGRLNLDATVTNYMEREVLRLDSARPAWVEIRQPDGELLRVSRATETDSWEVADVPEGRELTSPTAGTPVATSLSFTSFESVASAERVQPGEAELTTATFQCFDGLAIIVESWADPDEDDAWWCRFRAEALEPLAIEGGEASEELRTDGEDPGSDPDAPEDGEVEEEPVPEPPIEEAAELNEQWGPWVYRFGSFKAEQFRRRMEDLLKEPPAPEEPAETEMDGAPTEGEDPFGQPPPPPSVPEGGGGEEGGGRNP